ncbi:malto-oligosyltrehalose synthase [Streptomyces sp. NPDC059853]|uniref:malto-oligosyltrehalose synthase n=1 Tax=Streptomyces sp. NPDC059853 TaxID=3346973 RepID=UPI003649402A
MTQVPRTPTATYRVQLEPGAGFAAAARAVPRLAALGVSHLHLSPLLEAVPGSRHGYDVTDHSRVRAELGGEPGLRHLAATARAHGLGLIADIVPNHMALPADTALNAPLWRLLRDGPGSPAAAWFDLDPDPAAGDGRMTLPVLAGPAADERHALRVEDGTLRYGDHHRFPLRPGTEDLPLDALLDAQHYRLAWWRTARTELTYRRFFTVSELIAVRVEDPAVFEATHATVLRLLAEGVLTGLRIDHPDGLADPEGYLRRLRRRAGPGVWVVAEKILGPGERLPAGWPVAGTTGYDALRQVDAVLTDPAGAEQLTAHYRAYTGAPPGLGGAWEPTERRAAHRVIEHELAAERARLLRTARRLCGPDHPTAALRTALTALLVALPVYRPYVPAGRPPSAADTALLATAAAAAAREVATPAERRALDALHDLALGRPARTAPATGRGTDPADFRVRFAQVSSALRAKAAEDCAGYRFTPLLSASEVGGDPARPALPPAAFHAHCARIQRDWPLTGTVYTTHDTKRSGDVRATLAALTEHPRGWADLLTEVTERAARAGVPAPDPHAAWGCWQTAFALAPSPDPDRLAAATLKAAREAALRTTWTEPDAEYEAALDRFVRGGPCGPPGYPVAALARELAPQIRANVLGAALLHLTMPGVPDVYRGSESVYRALVDPDNRRPAGPPRPLPDAAPDMRAGGPEGGLSAEKLWLTSVALRLRRARPEWFGAHATYTPLAAEGPTAEHALAFCRSERVITVAARLTRTLAAAGGWEGTVLPLPPGRWYDALAGDLAEASAPGEGAADGRAGYRGKTPLGRLLAARPVALLVRADGF